MEYLRNKVRDVKQNLTSRGRRLGGDKRGPHGPRRPLFVAVGVIILLALVAVAIIGGHAVVSPQSSRSASVVLHAPSDLSVSGTSDDHVVLSWQPATPTPVGYRVYRAVGLHGSYSIIGTVNAADVNTYTDSTGFMPGETYAYTVTAFDRQGESTPTQPVMAVVLAPPGPSPTIVVPTPLPTFVAVTPPTLTAIARLPQTSSTPQSAVAVSSASSGTITGAPPSATPSVHATPSASGAATSVATRQP